MEIRKTQRGFGVSSFSDGNDHGCSIQESSACRDEGMLWLGIDNPIPKIRVRGDGWVPIKMPKGDISIPGRMHLTQTQVGALLPLLTYFAEHGCLPREGKEIPKGKGCVCCRVHSSPDSGEFFDGSK